MFRSISFVGARWSRGQGRLHRFFGDRCVPKHVNVKLGGVFLEHRPPKPFSTESGRWAVLGLSWVVAGGPAPVVLLLGRDEAGVVLVGLTALGVSSAAGRTAVLGSDRGGWQSA